MASNTFIAFFVAGGAFMFVYSRFNRKTGGNTKNTLIISVTAAAFAFLLALALLGLIPEASPAL